jgi:3-oxoacyl-[acyl-carrier protein] reductase
VKRALVTGGSGAIGSAVCDELGRRGLHVIVHAHRNEAGARAIAAAIRASGGSAEITCFDVADRANVNIELEKLLQEAPVQVLVNNAGIHDDGPLAGMTAEQWDRVIAVSLTGFFNVTQPLLLPMIRSRWGRIINVSSVTAVVGNRGQVNYAAAKAGLHGATRSLAIELASRGITVNAVAPGIIDTEATREVFAPERIAELVPMKRAGAAAEVASLIGYLSSEEAGYISGQVISVNGAMA